MNTIRFTLLLTLVLLAGCRTMDRPARAAEEAPKTAIEGTSFAFTGTVVFVPLEGGFYGIVGDDGRRYNPLNLPEALRRDGVRVRVKARLPQRGASFHMWGKRIEIVEIKTL